MKWFKHDSDASVDAKLERVMMKYGMEGYGLYWFCLEIVARSVEKHNLTFELEHDAEIIAHRVGIHYEKVQEMMTYMVKLGLFENDRGVVTCLKMATRTDEYTQKLLKCRGTVPTISRQYPDSVERKSVLIEEKRREEKRREKNRIEKEGEKTPSPPPPEKSEKPKNGVPYSKIVDAYHAILPELPRVVKLTADRKAKIRQRMADNPTIEDWEAYFRFVRESKFLMGKTDGTNGRPSFRANIDFLIRESAMVRAAEGEYHR